MTELSPKPVATSQTEMVQVVLPNDCNNFDNLLGGMVMHWIDLVAAVAAARHCKRPVVTASMDRLDFLSPVPRGAFCVLQASVNNAWRTSVEVGVKVFAEDPVTSVRHHTSSAYLTFVALDSEGKPAQVPSVFPESEEERRRYEEAEARRAERLRLRKRRGAGKQG